jgi:hypothetical protein
MEAHTGAMELTLEPWRLTLKPWRSSSSRGSSLWAMELTLEPWRLTLEPWKNIFLGYNLFYKFFVFSTL